MAGLFRSSHDCLTTFPSCFCVSSARRRRFGGGRNNFLLGFWFFFVKPMMPVPVGPSSGQSLCVCYRIWSRVRTAQLMRHARSISKPLVSPCLSTRAIWTFLGDLISHKVSAKQPLAGLVLDITKCFNILDRGLLRALMLRFGFPELIVDAWLAMLSQLSRTVLVEGAVYGCSTAVTGIPEGDPLSLVGMFVFAKAFDHFVQKGVASVLCLTYADNWELVARSARELIRSIPVVERFLDLCHLLVSPAKCWFWANYLPFR